MSPTPGFRIGENGQEPWIRDLEISITIPAVKKARWL